VEEGLFIEEVQDLNAAPDVQERHLRYYMLDCYICLV
jgi:hypothetical protein